MSQWISACAIIHTNEPGGAKNGVFDPKGGDVLPDRTVELAFQRSAGPDVHNPLDSLCQSEINKCAYGSKLIFHIWGDEVEAIDVGIDNEWIFESRRVAIIELSNFERLCCDALAGSNDKGIPRVVQKTSDVAASLSCSASDKGGHDVEIEGFVGIVVVVCWSDSKGFIPLSPADEDDRSETRVLTHRMTNMLPRNEI